MDLAQERAVSGKPFFVLGDLYDNSLLNFFEPPR
jgi:hypothetical protein